VSRTTIHGPDILEIDVDDHRFELLDLHAARLPEPIPIAAPDGTAVEFYFRTRDRLTLKSGKSLAERLLRKTGLKQVTVILRNDTWFIQEPTFPTYYKFSNEPVPTS